MEHLKPLDSSFHSKILWLSVKLIQVTLDLQVYSIHIPR